MRFLSLFRPAPYIDLIKDQEVVDKNYRYWRWRIFWSMFVGYAFFYFTRKSFTFAAPGLIADLGYTTTEVGILSTVLYLTYGFSKFVSGVMADRANPRFFMSIGLIITGLTNIFFGLSSSLFAFAVFWGLNGWFQGFGWPPVARLLTHWYSHNERGSWWSSWNVSHNIGGAIIPILMGFCLQYFGWRSAMFVPGFLCIIIGFFLLWGLRDTPQSLGLPSIEEYRGDYVDMKKGEKERNLSTKELLFDFVLKNKYLWLLAFAYFFVYVVRSAVNDWSNIFLVQTKGFQPMVANGCVSLFEVGGFCGSLAAGWSSDKLFGARRGPINVIFSLGMLLSLFGLWIIPSGASLYASISMFVIGFCVFGPQMMIGIAAAELAHKKAAGTATGFVGWFAYLGAASAGGPLGWIIDGYGWDSYFYAMIACSVFSVLLLLPTWGAVHMAHDLKTETA